MRISTTYQEGQSLGKRVLKDPQAETDPLTAKLQSNASSRSTETSSTGQQRSTAGLGFIARSKRELDFEACVLTSQDPGRSNSKQRSSYEYLRPLFTVNLEQRLEQSDSESIKNKNSTCLLEASQTGREGLEAARKARLVEHSSPFPQKDFSRRVKSQMLYLKKAADFLLYYYRDCQTADLTSISSESRVPLETLHSWIQHRHFILEQVRLFRL